VFVGGRRPLGHNPGHNSDDQPPVGFLLRSATFRDSPSEPVRFPLGSPTPIVDFKRLNSPSHFIDRTAGRWRSRCAASPEPLTSVIVRDIRRTRCAGLLLHMPRTAKQWSFDAARRESQRRRVAADRQGATLRACGTNSDASASAFRRPARGPRVALCPRAREIVPCQQGRSMVVVIFLTSGAQRVVETADSRVSTVHFSW
jgi:hypothetical protein